MAAMDIEKARALAAQMIRAGQNKGRSLEDLVRQLVAESEAGPQTATGAGLMIAPPPRTVTPATPAPMQPGVPLVAPKPTVEIAPQPQQRAAVRPSRYQQALDATLANIASAEAEMARAASAGQKPDIMAQIRLATLKEQANRLGALAQAEQGPEAALPEELRASLENRQARLARREELLAEAKARSPWEALLAGGAAMAQGRRGERFTEALARGLQAGMAQYGQARRAAEEGAESIGEARDQAKIDLYNMQERAREAARARALEIQGMDEKAEERALRSVRLPTQLRGEEAQTEEAVVKARYAPQREAASIQKDLDYAKYLRGQGRQTGGGGAKEPPGLNDYRDQMSKALNAYDEASAKYEGARANPDSRPEDVALLKQQVIAAGRRYNLYANALKKKYGVSPDIIIPETGIFAPKRGGSSQSPVKVIKAIRVD